MRTFGSNEEGEDNEKEERGAGRRIRTKGKFIRTYALVSVCFTLFLTALYLFSTGGTSDIWDEVQEEDDNVDGDYYDEDGYALHSLV